MSGEIEVRRLEECDLAVVAELERLSFAEPWSERALAYLLGESALGVVCLCEGRVVAYGGMQLVLDEGQITNIAVAPDCRRRGYGLAVMEALEREARVRGLVQISLEVRASNEAAIGLYRRLSYREAGRRKGFYRHPVEDALVMIRQF